PLPPLRFIVAPVIGVPFDEMVPVPVAVRFNTFVPVVLPPSAMLPFSAVDCIVKTLVADIAPVVVRSPAADSVNDPAPAVIPVEVIAPAVVMLPDPSVPLTAAAPESVTCTLAPELMLITKALVLRLPMLPVPLLRLTVEV